MKITVTREHATACVALKNPANHVYCLVFFADAEEAQLYGAATGGDVLDKHGLADRFTPMGERDEDRDDKWAEKAFASATVFELQFTS
jgi:hypothetical protein